METAKLDFNGRLGTLAAHPLVLLALLLCVNAVFMPYWFSIDALLYGFQALNRAKGNYYHEDLFFAFGSQDRYSLFSFIMAPLVSLLGLEAAFILCFIVCQVAFFGGMIRLVSTLIGVGPATTLAALHIAIFPVPYDGLGNFVLNDAYLTARIGANALVLFALERSLAGRWWVSACLLVVALLLHPLMAFPGLLVVVGSGLWTLGRAWLFSAALAGVPALLLAIPAIGGRWFTWMDQEWIANDLYLFGTAGFTWEKWLHLAAGTAVVLVGLRTLSLPARRLAVAVLVAAGLGVVASWNATEPGYALLRQGQPWRALWLFELLGVALGWRVAIDGLAGGPWSRVGAVFVLAFLMRRHWELSDFTIAASIALIVAAFLRGVRRTPRVPDWLAWSLGVGFLIGVILNSIGLWMWFFSNWELNQLRFDWYRCGWMISRFVDLPWRLLPALGLIALLPLANRAWMFRTAGVLAVVGISLQLFHGLYPESSFDRFGQARVVRPARWVREQIRERASPGRVPQVYWPRLDPSVIWFHVDANCWYNTFQQAGVLFSRKTAMEAGRRRRVAGVYELEQLRVAIWLLESNHARERANWLGRGLDSPPPDEADFRRLCAEPDLDFVVLPYAPLPGYVAEHDGLYLYDCRVIRAEGRRSP